MLLGGLEESRVSHAQEVGVIKIDMGCIRPIQTKQGQATPPSTDHRYTPPPLCLSIFLPFSTVLSLPVLHKAQSLPVSLLVSLSFSF